MMVLPEILRDNMNSWSYDDKGKMVPVKGASFKIIQAINEMNQAVENKDDENSITDL